MCGTAGLRGARRVKVPGNVSHISNYEGLSYATRVEHVN